MVAAVMSDQGCIEVDNEYNAKDFQKNKKKKYSYFCCKSVNGFFTILQVSQILKNLRLYENDSSVKLVILKVKAPMDDLF